MIQKKLAATIRDLYESSIKYSEDLSVEDKAAIQSLFGQIIFRQQKLEYYKTHNLSRLPLDLTERVADSHPDIHRRTRCSQKLHF